MFIHVCINKLNMNACILWYLYDDRNILKHYKNSEIEMLKNKYKSTYAHVALYDWWCVPRNRPFEWQKLIEFGQFTNYSSLKIVRKLAESGQFLTFEQPIPVMFITIYTWLYIHYIQWATTSMLSIHHNMAQRKFSNNLQKTYCHDGYADASHHILYLSANVHI